MSQRGGGAVNYSLQGLLMEKVRREMEPRESVFGDSCFVMPSFRGSEGFLVESSVGCEGSRPPLFVLLAKGGGGIIPKPLWEVRTADLILARLNMAGIKWRNNFNVHLYDE